MRGHIKTKIFLVIAITILILGIFHVGDVKRWLSPSVSARDWKMIIVHHTATKAGRAASFERNHRQRGMVNGIAYHFLIGNGQGMKDGEIFVSERWYRQLPGGHVKDDNLNACAIGIGLVGNFENTTPTLAQQKKLSQLVKVLLRRYNISEVNVHRHAEVTATKCPGKHFPWKTFLSQIKETNGTKAAQDDFLRY